MVKVECTKESMQDVAGLVWLGRALYSVGQYDVVFFMDMVRNGGAWVGMLAWLMVVGWVGMVVGGAVALCRHGLNV